MGKVPVPSFGSERTGGPYTRKLAMTSTDGRLVASRDTSWSCRSTAASQHLRSSVAKSTRNRVTALRQKRRTTQRRNSCSCNNQIRRRQIRIHVFKDALEKWANKPGRR